MPSKYANRNLDTVLIISFSFSLHPSKSLSNLTSLLLTACPLLYAITSFLLALFLLLDLKFVINASLSP